MGACLCVLQHMCKHGIVYSYARTETSSSVVEAAWHSVLVKILSSHSKSFEITPLSRVYVSSCQYSIVAVSVLYHF